MKNETNLFGILQGLMDRETVSEICIDRYNQIYFEEGGVVVDFDQSFESEEKLEKTIKKIFDFAGACIGKKELAAQCTLADGTRIGAVLPPMSLHGAVMTIMKRPHNELTWEDMKKFGAFDEAGAQILEGLLKNDKNILHLGNAGSGRVTMINNLLKKVDPSYRVSILEKNPEMKTNRARTMHLQATGNNPEGMKELVNQAFYLRCDYTFVNGLYGSEATRLLDYMREGYSSVLSILAESVQDGLGRIERKVLLDNPWLGLEGTRDVIGSSIDVVIFQKRFEDGARRVSEIVEVNHGDNGYQFKLLYHYDEKSKQFITA